MTVNVTYWLPARALCTRVLFYPWRQSENGLYGRLSGVMAYVNAHKTATSVNIAPRQGGIRQQNGFTHRAKSLSHGNRL